MESSFFGFLELIWNFSKKLNRFIAVHLKGGYAKFEMPEGEEIIVLDVDFAREG